MTRSALGDCCQNHDPLTAPVVFPRRVTMDGPSSLRAGYRCECGREWSCWWDMRAAGWTAADVESTRMTTVATLADACARHHPGDHPATIPGKVMGSPDGSWTAAYECLVCGHEWTRRWDAAGWPLERAEVAA